ncbi:hypothetical protein [Polynucleobacter sp. UK-Kesae-W10]|uniref:hypothetical protein n=1 Tax=Polynucleobacter sp. UK-Kesae-W10 TaxID=1819738 RepID=UPI001C0B89B6|nr:hypothetical protein [Polynucleobacter sp. UK-Kesae-W10]MBU3577604.1 hypothetical protein [Polynucleobacter sp. UK-Kesae-W10]
MAGLGFFGGMGTLSGGIMQGYQQGAQLQNQQDTADFLKTQRDRALKEQARDDTVREGIANTPTTETYQTPDPSVIPTEAPVQDGSMGPNQAAPAPMIDATRDRRQDDVLRDYAKLYKSTGNIEKYMDFNEKADKIGWNRASQQYNQLVTNSAGMSAEQVAKAAAEIYHNDPFAGGIKEKPVVNSDGTITVNVFNKNTGATNQSTFKNKDDLLASLQPMYQPEAFAKLQAAKQEMALKAQEKMYEERAKTVVMKPGDVAYSRDNLDGPLKESASNATPPKGYEDVTDPTTGTTRRVKIGGSGGSGGGVPKAIELGLKGNEALIPSATNISSILLQNNPNMPEAQANALAIEAANGKNMKSTFDMSTGQFNRHFTDVAEIDPKTNQPTRYATNKTYLVDSGEYSPNGSSVTKEQAISAVKQMETQAPEVFKQYVAATTPEGYKAFNEKIAQTWENSKAEAQAAYAQAQKDEQVANASGDRQGAAAAAARQQDIQNKAAQGWAAIQAENRKLELVKQFYKAPDKTNSGSSLQAPGGLYQPKAGVPTDLAARAQQVSAQQAKDQAIKDAASKVDTEAKAKRTAEVSWLTTAEAAVMKPNEAQQYLTKYQDVLPGGPDGEVARALRRQL